MLVFRKKRSPSPQKGHVPSASTTISAMQNETDWLSNAFRVAELASAAGGLLPFPYLKGAAELVKTLLKPIQQMQQNQDGYKTLTINVTTILQILHEEIKKDPEITASSLNYFEKDCEVFYRLNPSNSYLQRISNDLKSFNDKSGKSRFLRRYFAADRERDCLARFQNQIEEFRNNLLLRGIIRLQASSNTDETASHFEQIRFGDLNVLRSRSNGSVEHWEVRWRYETQTRMVRVYKGQNATSRFKAEKEWYTRISHPNVMQLFGLITSKDRPGLVFHNPWCIPAVEYDQRFRNALDLCVDFYRKEASYAEGLDYVEANACHHAFLSRQNWSSPCKFVGFKDRDDGYLCCFYVSLLDGCGIIALEWSPNILRDTTLIYQWQYAVINNNPEEELAMIIETVDTLRLSKQSNVTLDTSFLWDFYGAIHIRIWRDVPAPAYSVCTGDILLADENNNRLEASNAVVLGFIPCEEPSLSGWIIRDKELQKYFKTANRLSVEDCGGHFRIRVPVDIASISPAEDLETVVIDYEVPYSDWAAWELLGRAYVSQIAYLHARFDRVHAANSFCVVSGFSWHLQIPTRLGCLIGTSEYKELYFFISKPAIHDETLDTYWSLDPSGPERLDCSNIDTLGFNLNSFSVPNFRTLRMFDIHINDFELVWNAHVELNIDPESNEGARILGLPLMCIQHAGLSDVSNVFDEDIVAPVIQ